MFSDPLSVVIGAATIALPRVASPPDGGAFLAADQNSRIEVMHSKSKRTRHMVRLITRKIAADPLAAANNVEYRANVTITIDCPNVGFTPLELKDQLAGLAAWLTATSGANAVRFVGFEV